MDDCNKWMLIEDVDDGCGQIGCWQSDQHLRIRLMARLNKDEINEDYITRSRLKNLSSNILQLLADILQKSARIHDYDKF